VLVLELESRPKSSRQRRDIDVTRPRLWANSRDRNLNVLKPRQDKRLLKSNVYKTSRIF